jgi:hypothetical protein
VKDVNAKPSGPLQVVQCYLPWRGWDHKSSAAYLPTGLDREFVVTGNRRVSTGIKELRWARARQWIHFV